MKKMVMFLVVVMVLVMGIGMSVMAASEKEASYQISNEEYKELEQECLYDVKQILLEKGCKNAGVSITYITDEVGNREYTVAVHHAKLESMEGEEYSLLKARIEETAKEMLMTKTDVKKI